ncbi:MAG TPA: LL-diaminopimelate aminotransferase [Actinomycetota bacterium]|nr:LL-diaminopimelate aminotransferase [Actinomycetota bacterium]
MRTASRIDKIPPYLFASLDRKVSAARAKGVDVISFGVGDPDLPTPAHIVEAAAEAVRDPSTHQYPSYYGMKEFREAIARYYSRRFSVELDPDSQILPLIGSKEGIAHLATAFVDNGDTVLVSDPGYPVYAVTAIMAGGTPVSIPLQREKGFLPDFASIGGAAQGAKIMWLNFPGNPTGAVAGERTFSDAIDLAREHDLLVAHDAAYSEITFDGYSAPSVLQTDGALESAVEFGSLSKTFNMTGWRVGWVAGAEKAIEALGRVKTNIDSGIFNAIQRAGIAALDGPTKSLEDVLAVYARRRDALVSTLNSSGWDVKSPLGSIYLWAPLPEGETSGGYAEYLLEEAGIVVAPGAGYGEHGEGYIRFSLTVPDERLDEGLERLAKALASR